MIISHKLPIVVATALPASNACTLCVSHIGSFAHAFFFLTPYFALNHVLKQHQGHLSVRHLLRSLYLYIISTFKPDLPVHRFRPPNTLELREGSDIIVSFDDNLQTAQLRSAQVSSGPEKDGFSFDRVFPMGTKQDEVFDYGVKE
jgi:hypothetical protein